MVLPPPVSSRERKKEKDEPAGPSWLMTMTDMYTLLMVFFILMFAFLTMDRTKYIGLKQALREMHLSGDVEEMDAAEGGIGETAALAFQSLIDDKPSASGKLLEAPGIHALAQKLDDATHYTIGGQEGSFQEGRWDLSEMQKQALVGLKKALHGRRNIIEIRGHASGNFMDSVVFEENERVRPFTREDLDSDNRGELANHSFLSWLRANSVREFFLEPHEKGLGDELKYDERQIRIRAEGYLRNAVDPGQFNSAEEHLNRRIEVVLTSELLEK